LIIKPGEVLSAVKAGHKVVDLKGEVNESALIKHVQWDALGADIVHVDFTRVSATELVETKVQVELRGEAAGVKDGGALNFVTHELEIEAPANAIPEKIVVSVKDLQIDGEIFARDLQLPPGVRLTGHEDDVIVACYKPKVEEEEEAAAAPGPAEPELIRKEKTEEGEEGE
jgi:large subunit ribosomal protein L25